jgi:hypothetical protein
MKRMLVLLLAVLLLGACSKQSGAGTEGSNNSRSETTAPPSSSDKPKAGDTVLYQSNSGQRFYEAKLTSIEGTRAKLEDTDRKETAERELADIYAMPKAGSKATVQPGDIIAARFGQTSVWEAGEVVRVGDKITLKGMSSLSGSTREVLPEHVLTLSPAVAAKVKAAFTSKSK